MIKKAVSSLGEINFMIKLIQISTVSRMNYLGMNLMIHPSRTYLNY